jgi:hypothetical protein
MDAHAVEVTYHAPRAQRSRHRPWHARDGVVDVLPTAKRNAPPAESAAGAIVADSVLCPTC